jgi:hypothetical protein
VQGEHDLLDERFGHYDGAVLTGVAQHDDADAVLEREGDVC